MYWSWQREDPQVISNAFTGLCFSHGLLGCWWNFPLGSEEGQPEPWLFPKHQCSSSIHLASFCLTWCGLLTSLSHSLSIWTIEISKDTALFLSGPHLPGFFFGDPRAPKKQGSVTNLNRPTPLLSSVKHSYSVWGEFWGPVERAGYPTWQSLSNRQEAPLFAVTWIPWLRLGSETEERTTFLSSSYVTGCLYADVKYTQTHLYTCIYLLLVLAMFNPCISFFNVILFHFKNVIQIIYQEDKYWIKVRTEISVGRFFVVLNSEPPWSI